MQRKYGLGAARAGLVALMAVLVLTLLPASGFAAAAGDTAEVRTALAPITRDATATLARGAGYWIPAAAQRTIGIEKRRVAALQRLLTRLGKRPGPIDGLYGPLTEAGVIRFQRAAGVAPDGIVGRQTAGRLMAAAGQPALQPVRSNRSKPERRTVEIKRSRQPSGVGASLIDAAAPGQEEEIEPELMLVVALPLLLGSALVGALRGRVALAPARRRAELATEHPGSRFREQPGRHVKVRLKAIGYVSSGLNGRPDVERQMLAISSACEERGWELVEIVREADGHRPMRATAPGLAHTLQRVESGGASCVIVWSLPQLSPVVTELGSALRSIGRCGGRFVSLQDRIDTAEAAGRKAANVIVSVSGWEHERLGERTRKGLAAARAKGGSISRPSVQDVPRLREQIAQMRAEGMTLQAIADALNDEGVPTLRGGKKWRPSSVQAAAGYRRPKR